MLAESRQEFTENSQWRKVKGSFDHDPRYKAVESEKREELFKEHVKGLNDHPQVSEEGRERSLEHVSVGGGGGVLCVFNGASFFTLRIK